MSGQGVPDAIRAAVSLRAQQRCEYCHVPEGAVLWPHEADHIIAEQHGGQTDWDNLAFACFHCNRHKGPNVASVEAQTGRIVPLFNPRVHRWDEHFRAEGPLIVGLTDIGRATVRLLRFNAPERLLIRQALSRAGRWHG